MCPAPINAFATAAVDEVRRIREWTEPDLVFAPLWDVEAIGVLRETDLPVAIHVSTPAVITGTMAGFLRNDGTDPPELRRLLEVEAEVMQDRRPLPGQHGRRDGDDPRELRRALRRRPLAGRQHRLARSGRDCSATPMRSRRARRVFFVGRFESRKGIDTLLAAMERILPSYPDLTLILGRRGSPARARVAAGRVRRGWTSTATSHGSTGSRCSGSSTTTTLHDEYSRADVVVLPSRYESFGLVMVEAMMHGKPLVSTDTSGVREVVRNGVDGLLVEPGDVDQLERAIRRMLDDPDDAARLGRAARERFVDVPVVGAAHRALRAVLPRPPTRGHASPTTERPRGMLCAGEAATIDLTRPSGRHGDRAGDASAARSASSISDERAVDLEPGGRRRIRLDVTSGQAKLLVEQGTVRIERVVAVDMEPSGP